jgi:predicted DNA binding CopG/RHH family protein
MRNKKHAPKAKPAFRNEAEERRFWETHDSTEYVDWSSARRVRFPNLKPSTETISLRLPAGLLADLKVLANQRDVPYQSLLKMFLADRVAREWRESRLSTPASEAVQRAGEIPARARGALTPPATEGNRPPDNVVSAAPRNEPRSRGFCLPF